MNEKYYIPWAEETFDGWYGSSDVVCVSRSVLENLISDWADGDADRIKAMWDCWREASEEDIKKYGVTEG